MVRDEGGGGALERRNCTVLYTYAHITHTKRNSVDGLDSMSHVTCDDEINTKQIMLIINGQPCIRL